MKFRSEQEKAIFRLSQVLLGDQGLFQPENYDSGMKEPADLVWVSGRCVVLIYMTSGEKCFDRKRRHNYAQMHRWIRHWKGGFILRGKIGERRVEFSYDDADFIVGLSVIGGRDIGCIYEHQQVCYGDEKLAACATITDRTFSKLSDRSIGVRDIVNFLSALDLMGGRVDENAAIGFIEDWVSAAAKQSRDLFSGLWPDHEDLNHSWNIVRGMMMGVKARTDISGSSEVISELDVRDMIWLSVAERSLARQLAPPGQFGHLAAFATRRSDTAKILCVVAVNILALTRNIAKIPKNYGLCFFAMLDCGVTDPMRLVAFGNPKPDVTLNDDLRRLRGRSLDLV